MRTALVAGLSLLALSATAIADPVGRYLVEGAEPGGGGAYTGTVTVDKTGDTYRVTWEVGGERYSGTGIGNKDFIAISYTSKSESGLALYGADGQNWKGIWAYSNGRQLGTEAWVRR